MMCFEIENLPDIHFHEFCRGTPQQSACRLLNKLTEKIVRQTWSPLSKVKAKSRSVPVFNQVPCHEDTYIT